MSATANVSRQARLPRFAVASILGLSSLVALLTVPGGAPGSSPSRDFASHAALAGFTCPTLVGTTQWTGHSSAGAFTATFDVADDGVSVSGTVSMPPFLNSLPENGVVSCDPTTGVPTVNFSDTSNQIGGFGSVTVSGNSLSASGTFVVAPPFCGLCTGPISGPVTATAQPVPDLLIAFAPFPATPGPVTYVVTVPGSAIIPALPTGTVTVTDGHGGMCTNLPIVSGAVSCTMTEDYFSSPYTITASYSGDGNYAPATQDGTVGAGIAEGGSGFIDIVSGIDGATAVAFGPDGAGTITGAEYGSDPVGNLQSNTGDPNNTQFYDVQLSTGNSFTSVYLHGCVNVNSSTQLLWWDPTLNGGSGDWAAVRGQGGEPAVPTGSPLCLSVTLDNSTYPTLAQLTGTVFATTPGRAITSATGASAVAGSRFSLAVTTIGTPVHSITSKGKLPRGIRLRDNHNGTATLSGTARGTKAGGVYHPVITAAYGTGAGQQKVSQTLSLFVFQTPVFARKASATVHVGRFFRLTTSAKAFPMALVTESGALPPGVTFTSGGNGTGTLQGVPHAAGTYLLTLSASTGMGTPVTKSFTLTVKST